MRCSAELRIEGGLVETKSRCCRQDRNGGHFETGEESYSTMRTDDAGSLYTEKHLDAVVGDRHPSCSPSDP